MNVPLDAGKSVVLVFCAAVAQVSIFSGVHLLGGTPDVLLLTLVAVSLLRGAVFGAVAGFGAGLVVDTANLETLGVTSLLLTLAGYWIGRYGETTGRDRSHAPFLSVAVVTFLYALGALAFHFLLGEPAPARVVLLDSLFPSILWNLLLTWPVYALCRRLLPFGGAERGQEVRLLG
jgi:rod shape-determining protein MreD